MNDERFTGPGRTDEAAVREQREAFLDDSTAGIMLEAMPGPAMIVNSDRQIIAHNRQLAEIVGHNDIETSLGLRPGEILACVHSVEQPGGCGMSDHCNTCGAKSAMIEALGARGASVRECRITSHGQCDGVALDFRVHAKHMRLAGEDCLIVSLADISADKRRQVLERVFFHDLLNEIGGLHALASMLMEDELDPELEDEFKTDIHKLSGAIIEEIEGHRAMLAAERGDLVSNPEVVPLNALLEGIVQLYRYHPVAEGRSIRLIDCDDLELHTDVNMLRRSLGNLIKNALEATTAGGEVTVGFEPTEDHVRFFVRNPGTIPRDVQLQIFQRSFSTKAATGRGIGTYSVRLFVERYLSGNVGFRSEEGSDTEFFIELSRAAGGHVHEAA